MSSALLASDPRESQDCRARRVRLGPDSFAIAPDVEEPPSDLIDVGTWRGLVWLTDDVSLRTSDHHGTALSRALAAWGDWLTLVLDVQSLVAEPASDPLAVAAMGAAEEFQASISLALTGFYRQALGTLRAALESLLAALDFSVRDDPSAVAAWLEGSDEGRFWASRVRRRLAQLEPFRSFRTEEDSLFGEPGWFAWLYDLLCAFVHGRPAHTVAAGHRIDTTNGGLWDSNGPLYVGGVFDMWARLFFDVMLMSALMVALARPALTQLEQAAGLSLEAFVKRLMDWHPTPGVPRVAAVIAEYLMPSS